MIRRLNQFTNLALTGMAVVVPSGGDINEFGRLMFRGLPVTGQFGNSFSLEAASAQAIQQVCAGLQLEISQLSTISLSPSLTTIFQENDTYHRVLEVTAVSAAFSTASDWLETGGEEFVLLVDARADPQTVCALLVARYNYVLENARPVFARVTGAAGTDAPLNAQSISSVLQEARLVSGIQTESIGLIDLASRNDAGILAGELEGLLGAFSREHPGTCAIGASLPGLLGVVKTAWCLSRRVIPAIPGWGEIAQPEAWKSSPFYIPTESRTWFIPSSQGNRNAGLNLLEPDGGFTHLLFSDGTATLPQVIEAPRREALRLFPITASSFGKLVEKITALRSNLSPASDLVNAALENYSQYILDKPNAEYTVCLLGQTQDELLREIGYALKGIPTAVENQTDWQTPLGSFFTPHPLGKDCKISFIYPGAFNSYPGVGRDLFYLFPNLFEQMNSMTGDIGGLLNERLLYPRSTAVLTSVELAAIENQLNSDPITMLVSGTCLAVLYTSVLRNVFEIHPTSAFGYSLGETSMMFASGVWTDADGSRKALMESPLFHTRLTGPQNAVREFWNLPTRSDKDPHEEIWENYLLMIDPEKVLEVIKDETHVYLTHINTPRQVVIGGDPAACRRVIDRLKCKSLQAPFNYAIHCEPIHSEFDLLTDLHSLPVMGQPGMTLYSAAASGPMPIERQKIARQIAEGLCNCLDFPRLIQVAYDDGARIFIELGAGSNCARWVNDTLQGKPHAAYSINRKAVDDYSSILRLLSRITSHQAHVNLSVLYQD